MMLIKDYRKAVVCWMWSSEQHSRKICFSSISNKEQFIHKWRGERLLLISKSKRKEKRKQLMVIFPPKKSLSWSVSYHIFRASLSHRSLQYSTVHSRQSRCAGGGNLLLVWNFSKFSSSCLWSFASTHSSAAIQQSSSQFSPRQMHPNMQWQSGLATLLLPVLLLHWEGVSYPCFLTEISRSPISFGLIEEVGEGKKEFLFAIQLLAFFTNVSYCLFLTVLVLFRIMLEIMFSLRFFPLNSNFADFE